MYEPSKVLPSNLASVTEGRRKRPTRALTTDRTLQALVADLAAARVTVGMTQEEVAARMWTTKSVVAVGATVAIRVRPLSARDG